MIGDPFQDAVLIALIVVTVGGASAMAAIVGRRYGRTAAVAAATTCWVGVSSAGFAIAHLVGVLYAATQRGDYYMYDFRFASLVLVGILLIIGGALCVAALFGVRQGRQPDWGRATEGSLLLLVVAAPLLPVQPDLASGVVIASVANLLATLGVRRRSAQGRPA